jgi:Rrf2 family nitric oxide-sensitive transcriptional repressor
MHLTRFTDLGLRVLMYLMHARPDTPVTNAEIASQFKVPHNHVIKVVHKLGKLGWIETQRGRGGGLQLAVSPKRLRLGEVLQALEGTVELVDCDSPPCVLSHRCSLKGVLDEALAAFYAKLNEHTLGDLDDSRTANQLLTLHRKYAG